MHVSEKYQEVFPKEITEIIYEDKVYANRYENIQFINNTMRCIHIFDILAGFFFVVVVVVAVDRKRR